MKTKQIQEQTTYLSCAETAKLVRKALKENFPSQKFSVISHTYSGGASINVSWDEGMMSDEVSKLCNQFAGSGFDGMIDYKFYKNHWMMPDGSIMAASSEGSHCTGGYTPGYNNAKPHPDAKKVSMGANYVFTNRDIGEDTLRDAAKQIAELNKLEFDDMNEYPKDNFFGGMGKTWWNIARELLYKNELNGDFKIIRSEETCSGSWTNFYKVLPTGEAN